MGIARDVSGISDSDSFEKWEPPKVTSEGYREWLPVPGSFDCPSNLACLVFRLS